jgi:hypothetical protein
MKVFACPEAKCFLSAWPGLVSGAGHELEAETTIAASFSEANTQTAFMSLAARQKDFETALRVQTAQLNVLTHRTEALSPSRKRLGASDLPVQTAIGSTPGRGEELAHGSDPPLPPSLCTHCGHHATPNRDNNHLHGQLPITPGVPGPVPPPADPVGVGIPLDPIVDTPTMPSQNNLCVVAINAKNQCFHVLRLSPGPVAPPTPFDIILPSAATFCDGVDKLQAQYPTFTPASCGWHAIFERITQPTLLWDCWGPGSLGEFPDVLTLWKSWDEGTMIEGVGQRPPLRLVDARWGCHRDMRSKKGHLSAWRPRNDDNVCLSIFISQD